MHEGKLCVRTPLWKSIPLSQRMEREVYLKMDCFQPTGSFKARGISELCQDAIRRGKKIFVSASGGNAGYTAAYVGRMLGIPVTVYVPETSREIFIKRIKRQGAEVRVGGKDLDAAVEMAKYYAQEVDGEYISPYDHPAIWHGHSRMIEEIKEEMEGEKPDAIVVSVGGGGLICGVMEGLERVGWGDVEVYGVETEGSASFAAAKAAGKLVTLPEIKTIATSLGLKTVTWKLEEWMKKRQVGSIVVSDRACVRAIREFVDDHRVLVEPSCSAMLATLYDKHESLMDKKRVVGVVCGGLGINMDLLKEYMEMFDLKW